MMSHVIERVANKELINRNYCRRVAKENMELAHLLEPGGGSKIRLGWKMRGGWQGRNVYQQNVCLPGSETPTVRPRDLTKADDWLSTPTAAASEIERVVSQKVEDTGTAG